MVILAGEEKRKMKWSQTGVKTAKSRKGNPKAASPKLLILPE
jgi:hypothetical protein